MKTYFYSTASLLPATGQVDDHSQGDQYGRRDGTRRIIYGKSRLFTAVLIWPGTGWRSFSNCCKRTSARTKRKILSFTFHSFFPYCMLIYWHAHTIQHCRIRSVVFDLVYIRMQLFVVGEIVYLLYFCTINKNSIKW